MAATLNRLKTRLDRGEVSLAMVVRYSRSVECVAIARAAGFHALYVDLEHAPLSLDRAGQICLAAQWAGVTPLVRVPAGRLDLIGRVLDGGALGVIVPHVATAAEARAAVAAARFPPLGNRSVGGPLVQSDYRPLPQNETAQLANETTLVVIMIESAEAVEHVDEIAQVDGVGMLLVGANDVLADAGAVGQYDSTVLDQAYRRVLRAGQRHGTHVGVGGLTTRLDLARRYVTQGARYVSVGTDLAFLLRGAAAAVAELGESDEGAGTS